MNLINKNLDKNNLHHAYLIEGIHEEIVPQILKFLNEIGLETSSNPDFCHMTFDSFKIEDARNLKSKSLEKGFSKGKKIYIISANSFLLEAQNTLLKMFEEPIENTHFFVIVPDSNTLLGTFISRFYLIKSKINIDDYIKDVEKFIKMNLKDRISFIKDLLIDENNEKDLGINTKTSKSKALKFLNALEMVLHQKLVKALGPQKEPKALTGEIDYFYQIFKVRVFINQPGSSQKSLMESVALSVPTF
ncbi:MAG: hypothetical protein WCO07_00125 [bacterium]